MVTNVMVALPNIGGAFCSTPVMIIPWSYRVIFTQGPRYPSGGHGTPLGQGTHSQQIIDPLGPEYTHRAKEHLTQQIVAHA